MQYILTEEEYKELVRRGISEKEKYKETINKLCQEVANLKSYGCIRNVRNDKVSWYCDDCPVLKTCLYDSKEYSK